ncbi:MAG: UvrD-helicase domain-containing protein [Nannocystaceae bacterium]
MVLNPEQSAAVAHRGSALLVLAGAGTGKTRVITHRVAALLDEGIPPWRILAVTFTNKAAEEMRARIDRLCDGRHATKEIWVGTFHSICARLLRRFDSRRGCRHTSPSTTPPTAPR